MKPKYFVTDGHTNGKLHIFMEYKNREPFFKEPIKITMGTPLNDTYHMVKNVVYHGKQILALKHDQNPNTLVLVEAKITDGQLIHISKLPVDLLSDISRMVEKTL
jgi:hypothetical protein